MFGQTCRFSSRSAHRSNKSTPAWTKKASKRRKWTGVFVFLVERPLPAMFLLFAKQIWSDNGSKALSMLALLTGSAVLKSNAFLELSTTVEHVKNWGHIVQSTAALVQYRLLQERAYLILLSRKTETLRWDVLVHTTQLMGYLADIRSVFYNRSYQVMLSPVIITNSVLITRNQIRKESLLNLTRWSMTTDSL